MYLDKGETPWIMEIEDNGLGWNSDLKDRLVDPYLEL